MSDYSEKIFANFPKIRENLNSLPQDELCTAVINTIYPIVKQSQGILNQSEFDVFLDQAT